MEAEWSEGAGRRFGEGGGLVDKSDLCPGGGKEGGVASTEGFPEAGR